MGPFSKCDIGQFVNRQDNYKDSDKGHYHFLKSTYDTGDPPPPPPVKGPTDLSVVFRMRDNTVSVVCRGGELSDKAAPGHRPLYQCKIERSRSGKTVLYYLPFVRDWSLITGRGAGGYRMEKLPF